MTRVLLRAAHGGARRIDGHLTHKDGTRRSHTCSILGAEPATVSAPISALAIQDPAVHSLRLAATPADGVAQIPSSAAQRVAFHALATPAGKHFHCPIRCVSQTNGVHLGLSLASQRAAVSVSASTNLTLRGPLLDRLPPSRC